VISLPNSVSLISATGVHQQHRHIWILDGESTRNPEPDVPAPHTTKSCRFLKTPVTAASSIGVTIVISI
jgi:hypothetical protein